MRKWLSAVGVSVVLAVFSSTLLAQWPTYPGKGVPRTADGKPNLTAPAPRTADGKPDLSGLWENRFGFGAGGGAGAARGAAAGAPAPAAPVRETPPLATFFNIGIGFKEGLPFQPWAAELRKTRTAAFAKDNPDANCLPMGFMQLHLHPQPRQIVQTPGLLLMIYEGNYGLRQVFTDGRPLPNNDPQPWWDGYSIGKWDGDTLVVESTGFRDEGWLDVNGSPYTDKLNLTERFRRPTFGTMEIDLTIDDPKAYTKPFTVRVNHRILPDEELIEFICLENEQSSKHYVK